VKIRVYYEDTDAGGIVYHANYLKYCERARSEFFFSQNMTPVIDDAHFVVRKMDCDFISSALFADVVDVTTDIKEIKKASFILTQEIKRDEKLLFKAEVTLVLAKNGRPLRIDENIKDMLQSLFAKIEN
jgi:acyl-CoA thioester hydrolase